MPKNISKEIVSWRAWYTGGRVFESTETRWEDLPELGVLWVNIYYRTRPFRRKMNGRSLYWIEETPDGTAYCYDDAADAVISDDARAANRVKRGKWVSDLEFDRVMKEATESHSAPDESLRVGSRHRIWEREN